jgi:hypothetical protein
MTPDGFEYGDDGNGNWCPLCGELVEDFDPLTDSECPHCAVKLREVFEDD